MYYYFWSVCIVLCRGCRDFWTFFDFVIFDIVVWDGVVLSMFGDVTLFVEVVVTCVLCMFERTDEYRKVVWGNECVCLGSIFCPVCLLLIGLFDCEIQ